MFNAVQIVPTEEFGRLSKAPVVEAVIDLRAQCSPEMDEASCREALEPEMAGYTFCNYSEG